MLSSICLATKVGTSLSMNTQQVMIQSEPSIDQALETVHADLIKHSRSGLAFTDVARNFFMGLPGVGPIVVLILNEENVILETIVPYDDVIINEREIVMPGSHFHIAYSPAELPYLHQRSMAKKLHRHALESTWNAGVIAMRHPTISSRERRVILLTPVDVSTEVMLQMLTSAAYAICQLWYAAVTEKDMLMEADTQSLEFHELEHKLQEFEKFSSLASLSAGIAHEIRNPLTTARGFLQLFEQRCAPADRDYLQLTIHELDRIQHLLVDFMGLCRPDSEAFQTVDTCMLTQSVCDFLCPEASLYSVELLSDIPVLPVMLHLQPGRIKQVLINLVKNAIHACDKGGGQVHLQLRDNPTDVTIIIADTGCGISDMNHLFDPFHTTKMSGTGLGLFVSKHIVEEHRGHIHIDSAIGHGTTIMVYLPKST